MSLSALRLVVAVPAVAVALAACEGCRSTETSTRAVPSGSPQVAPPTVRLYLVTDLAGALEPCGCTKDQLGGLDHFGAWVKREQARAPAALVASAGPLFFMDDKLEGDRADQDRIKAQTIARVLRGLGFAAFAPGHNDWVDGGPALATLADASGAAMVLASGKPVVREVGGVHIGFVGYGQSKDPSSPLGPLSSSVRDPSSRLGPLSSSVRDPTAPGSPEEAVRRGVEEAKARGAQVLVALAAVGRGEAKRLADAVPELTAVVVGAPKSTGDANTTAPQGEQVGDVLVVQASNHLQSVAVLDLYVREALVPGHIVKFADATGLELSRKREEIARRIDELHVKIAAWERDPSVAPGDVAARRAELADLESQREALDVRPPPSKGSFFRYSLREMRESLGRDPAVEADMTAYYKAVNDHNRALFAGRLPPASAPGQATYVGVEACTTCHPGPRAVYSDTPHSRAYPTLTRQFKEYNLECVSCHVTGYEQPGGSTVTHVDKLENVQCEVCHGPGSKHVANPADKAALVARPAGTRCLECHHPPHVEEFDPAVKMREILGPGHGMPPR
jgi:hypothetical protein